VDPDEIRTLIEAYADRTIWYSLDGRLTSEQFETRAAADKGPNWWNANKHRWFFKELVQVDIMTHAFTTQWSDGQGRQGWTDAMEKLQHSYGGIEFGVWPPPDHC
jgi:hypothetical protein